jgi:hypothetical protein
LNIFILVVCVRKNICDMQVIEMMRQQFGDIFRFVLCTALTDAEAEELAKGTNAMGYITKPYSAKAMIEKIHAIAAEPSPGAPTTKAAAQRVVKPPLMRTSAFCSMSSNDSTFGSSRYNNLGLQHPSSSAKPAVEGGSPSKDRAQRKRLPETAHLNSALPGHPIMPAIEPVGSNSVGLNTLAASDAADAVSAGAPAFLSANLQEATGGSSVAFSEHGKRSSLLRHESSGPGTSADTSEQSSSRAGPIDAPNVAMVVPFHAGTTDAVPYQEAAAIKSQRMSVSLSKDLPRYMSWERMHSSRHDSAQVTPDSGEHSSSSYSQKPNSASPAAGATGSGEVQGQSSERGQKGLSSEAGLAPASAAMRSKLSEPQAGEPLRAAEGAAELLVQPSFSRHAPEASCLPRHPRGDMNRLCSLTQPSRASYERLRDVLNALTDESPGTEQGQTPSEPDRFGSHQPGISSRKLDIGSLPRDVLSRPDWMQSTHQACNFHFCMFKRAHSYFLEAFKFVSASI